MTAPSDGPTMTMQPRENDSSALACWMCSRATTRGTTLVIAGKVNAATTPLSASRTTIIQISATPVSSKTATAA